MAIQFRCEGCHKDVQAPDSAGGKRGKCPFCGASNYIPSPVSDDDVLPLAPIDEEEERLRKKEVQDLLRQEHDLLSEIGGRPAVPDEDEGKGASKRDLRDLVVKYCLDMHGGKLPPAQAMVQTLKKQGPAAIETVTDFMSGKEIDPALATMPGGLLQGFLRQLRQSLQETQ